MIDGDATTDGQTGRSFDRSMTGTEDEQSTRRVNMLERNCNIIVRA